jgi:hypothetical protein
VIVEHMLRTKKRHLGRSPIKGSRPRYGTDANCSCAEWTWFTNEYPPSRGGDRDAQEAHARHVAATTPESDVAATEKLLAEAERLAEVYGGRGLELTVEVYVRRVEALRASLAADRAAMKS